MTKREAKANKAAYQRAIAEGRVVRYSKGEFFRVLPTAALAAMAVKVAESDGYIANVVNGDAQ